MPKLSKRADGRYQMNVYVGQTDAGKPKYKTIYGTTQKEVRIKADELRVKLGKGIDIEAQRDTFATWRERWLATKKGSVCAKMYDGLQSFTAPVVEVVGCEQIDRIRPSDIQNVIDELVALGRAKSSLQKTRSYTDQIFRLAVVNRVIDFNPVVAVYIPSKAPVGHRKALKVEQQQQIVDTPHRAQTPAMIMLYAGLRRGEVIPLRWADIDLDARTIQITKSVEMIHGQSSLKAGAKTEAGERVVDIPQRLADYLRTKKPEQLKGKKVIEISPLVCPANNGEMMSQSAWRRLWESYMQDLNIKYGYKGERSKHDPQRKKKSPIVMLIEPFSAHQLRHTYATMLYLAGVDPLTAMQQLGHADIKTTLGIYTHLDQQYKRRAMDKLDTYLSPDANKNEQSILVKY